MNKVLLVGRLGRDPELKATPSGSQVCNFSIAVKDQDSTVWVDCVAWNKAAEALCKFVHKGEQVGIEGRLQVRTWEKDGQKRSKTEVVVDRLEFLSDRREEKPSPYDADNEELPF